MVLFSKLRRSFFHPSHSHIEALKMQQALGGMCDRGRIYFGTDGQDEIKLHFLALSHTGADSFIVLLMSVQIKPHLMH